MLGFGMALVLGWVSLTWLSLTAPVGGDTSIRVEIPSGTSSRAIGQLLEDQEVIRSAQAWQFWARTLGRGWIFQAGIYDLDPSLPMVSVAKQLRAGQTVQVAITIPEGWRLEQIGQAMAEQNWFSTETFTDAAGSLYRLQQTDWFPAEAPSLEGYLFPDTYHLSLSLIQEGPPFQRAEALVRAMLEQFETVALPLYQSNQSSQDPSSLTLNEWVTLASIVEKESVVAEERTLIAGVFNNRLKQGMPLGADPTVEYALNIQQTPDRRLTLAEVRTPSPYNTYVNVGLPPGPIANPGLASLEATLAPADTDLLYFVARYDGTHIFSRTYEEHLAAQRQVLENRQ